LTGSEQQRGSQADGANNCKISVFHKNPPHDKTRTVFAGRNEINHYGTSKAIKCK
jgi:hypothetical protein